MAEPRSGLDPLELPAVVEADVYKGGALAAHLRRTPNGVEFRYTDSWVAEAGCAVASTLPVTAEPMISGGGAVPAYFAGLLPEGRRLTALRAAVKTSIDDELSLLLAVGADAVGNVQVVPAGRPLNAVPPLLEVDAFSHLRFADLLADIDIRVDRVGLAGVQVKASLLMLNLAVTKAGEQYLIKLEPPEFPGLVEDEDFFLDAARRSGLAVVDTALVRDRDGAPGLLVTRFDRAKGGDGVRSFAVEDGCQALGLHPEAKYRITSEQVLGRLSSLCEAPIPAARTFLAQAVFAYLTGNGDAHAKNFSILQDQTGRWLPAPAYDLPSSQPYGDNTMALSVAGRRDGNITGSRYIALGEAIGLPGKAARRTVEVVAGAADTWIDGLGGLPFDAGRIAKLRKVVLRRQRLLLRDQ